MVGGDHRTGRAMCGIVGLFLKDKTLEPDLGRLFAPMLHSMEERGPDSAGFAIYRDSVGENALKVTLFHRDENQDWSALAAAMETALGVTVAAARHASHAVFTVSGTGAAGLIDGRVRAWLERQDPAIRIMSVGRSIEIYKEKGLPREVTARFDLATVRGSHAIGHTRMATESAVTTEHSHPFSTGIDLCLVHNGSLSNHNRLRAVLRRSGVPFQTDNDSEVAAGFLSHRMAEGDDLGTALEAALSELDGFYTFAIGTRDGFAVLRDPIACKPAVLAETDAWVAMSSEYRAIAHLPGCEEARIWEPKPATVYRWSLA